MKKSLSATVLALMFLLLIVCASVPVARSDDEEEAKIVKLSKTVRFAALEDAKSSLTDRLLAPPVVLGSKREQIRAKLGEPEEIIGFGNEYYKIKDATLLVSYVSDQSGEAVANLVEFRPDRETPWTNWLKPAVQLPKPGQLVDKKYVRLTVQIRIGDVGQRRSLHLTLIGNQDAVNFIHWSLIF